MCANIVKWKVDFAQGRSQSSQVPQLPWMWSSKWVGEPDCWTSCSLCEQNHWASLAPLWSFGDILKHSKTFGRHTWRTRWQDSRWRVSCEIQYESISLLLRNFCSRCVIMCSRSPQLFVSIGEEKWKRIQSQQCWQELRNRRWNDQPPRVSSE